MYNGKRLAFDYGSVRIGVAISDSSGILATPFEVLKNDEKLENNLEILIQDISPSYIAVGIPKQLSGQEGSKYQEVKSFVEKIKKIYGGKIFGIDERLTTVSAASKLRESGRSAKDSKDLIDSAAAVLILEGAMQIEQANGLSKCEI